MRTTEAGGLTVHPSSRHLARALRLAAVVLGIGLVVANGAARAEDDEDEDLPFEKRIVKSIVEGVGGTNMENRGIDYRERSPLVVPPKLNLPPPDTGASARAANWPKDPDVEARRAAAAAEKNATPLNGNESFRSLTPAEMAPKRVKRTTTTTENERPGDPIKNPMLTPSQLGYEGGLFKNMFGSSSKGETAPFTGEPARESLTQPPPGYQTPASGYAYGTGPKEVLRNGSEINPMTGKY